MFSQKEIKFEKERKKPSSSGIHIHNVLSPAKVTEVYDSYWKFAALRQEVFFKRVDANPLPWTDDVILNNYKFTNAYRAADRVSQYLIKEVIYNPKYPDSPKETLFRILLFKLFNKIETWELLSSEFDVPTFEDYNFEAYDKILNQAMAAKEKNLFSSLYYALRWILFRLPEETHQSPEVD